MPKCASRVPRDDNRGRRLFIQRCASGVLILSGGVYLEWRFADALLYFEADDESVLMHMRRADGTDTTEDASFDVQKAKQAVLRFISGALSDFSVAGRTLV